MSDLRDNIGRRAGLTGTLCIAVGMAMGCAAEPTPKTASDAETFSSRFSGKTTLYYEASHGNQIEYYDPGGRAFLWYPGNRGVVPGEWREEGQSVCFRYGKNAYNPVTHQQGGAWECSPLQDATRHVIDATPGDVFGLGTGSIPYSLPAHPRFEAVSAVKAAP